MDPAHPEPVRGNPPLAFNRVAAGSTPEASVRSSDEGTTGSETRNLLASTLLDRTLATAIHSCRDSATMRDMSADDDLNTFLVRYGQAVSSGDLPTVASCWEVPAYVLTDEGVLVVSEVAEIERFFGQAVECYRAQGLVETRPDLQHVESLGQRLRSVDARWPAFDAAGQERSSEQSRYLRRLDDDGQPRIRVAITISHPPA